MDEHKLLDNLKDEELLLRLCNTEDSFVERKLFSDSGDWLKTVVAFANSTPIKYPAVLFIGVKNDGTPEEKGANLESVMKTFGQKVSKAYPEIYYLTKILRVADKEVLAIVIPGSPQGPHFAGPSYVRVGSESKVASEEQFGSLIASRCSKVREILKWRGELVTVEATRRDGVIVVAEEMVVDCNQFYVTLEDKAHKHRESCPLARTEASFDQQKNRLKLEVRPV